MLKIDRQPHNRWLANPVTDAELAAAYHAAARGPFGIHLDAQVADEWGRSGTNPLVATLDVGVDQALRPLSGVRGDDIVRLAKVDRLVHHAWDQTAVAPAHGSVGPTRRLQDPPRPRLPWVLA